MNKPFYEFEITEEALRFEFESVGNERVVRKVVRYAETNVPDLYNLSLVDVLANGAESDTAITDNGDMEKVLATVFRTFSVFLNHYPDRMIFFMGSTPARTRLYQIAIRRELTEALTLFSIRGLTDNGFKPFVDNQTYKAFVFTLK